MQSFSAHSYYVQLYVPCNLRHAIYPCSFVLCLCLVHCHWWKVIVIVMLIGVAYMYEWVKERKGWWLSGSGIGSLSFRLHSHLCDVTSSSLSATVMSILRLFSGRWQSRQSRRARLRQRPTSSESGERSRLCLPFNTQTSFTSMKVSVYSWSNRE